MNTFPSHTTVPKSVFTHHYLSDKGLSFANTSSQKLDRLADHQACVYMFFDPKTFPADATLPHESPVYIGITINPLQRTQKHYFDITHPELMKGQTKLYNIMRPLPTGQAQDLYWYPVYSAPNYHWDYQHNLGKLNMHDKYILNAFSTYQVGLVEQAIQRFISPKLNDMSQQIGFQFINWSPDTKYKDKGVSVSIFQHTGINTIDPEVDKPLFGRESINLAGTATGLLPLKVACHINTLFPIYAPKLDMEVVF